MKWVTRSHVHVDRVACPWLITRFVDSQHQFAVYDALYAWCRLDTARTA